jgi:hypothetical protein
MTAKRLGMSVTCTATLTVGLVGEVLSLLALLVTCSATLTVGLVGEADWRYSVYLLGWYKSTHTDAAAAAQLEARFMGGAPPSVTIAFLKEPVLQVQTSRNYSRNTASIRAFIQPSYSLNRAGIQP